MAYVSMLPVSSLFSLSPLMYATILNFGIHCTEFKPAPTSEVDDLAYQNPSVGRLRHLLRNTKSTLLRLWGLMYYFPAIDTNLGSPKYYGCVRASNVRDVAVSIRALEHAPRRAKSIFVLSARFLLNKAHRFIIRIGTTTACFAKSAIVCPRSQRLHTP